MKLQIMSLAPIILFVYNRPWHTKQTVEALMKNELASKSELFIYADGPKDNFTVSDKINISEVRTYINSISQVCGDFKSVTIFENEKNKGLANSIIDGVTEIINKYEKAIVLEDDLVTSPYFLKFMNEALKLYKNESKVGMIHGHIYDIKNLPENFFLYKSGCLGWGTWKRVWREIDFDGEHLLRLLYEKKLTNFFDCNSTYPYTQMLNNQIKGLNSSWAVRVYANNFLKELLTFYPGESLVRHIGFNQGTHCNPTSKPSRMDGKLTSREVVVKKISVVQDEDAYIKLQRFYRKELKQNIFNRVYNKCKKILLTN